MRRGQAVAALCILITLVIVLTNLDVLTANTTAEPPTDPRPPVWVGHVSLETAKFQDTFDFLTAIGIRKVVRKENFAVLELRGGTHIVLRANTEAAPGPAPFDLMVDDLDQYRQHCLDQGLTPTTIHNGSIHRSFEVQEPGGLTFKFNDSHAVGPV